MSDISQQVLVEAAAGGQNEVDLVILAAGWGNKLHNHYYPARALEEAARKGVFNGCKMFADHLTESAKRALGGMPRSIRDLVGRVTDTWYDQATQTLRGRARIVPWLYDTVKADPDLIEVSINASGSTSQPKMIEGRLGRMVESINRGMSVDWVATGGAGGKVVALLESYREEVDHMLEDLTVEALVEARADLVQEILDGPLNQRAALAESTIIEMREAQDEDAAGESDSSQSSDAGDEQDYDGEGEAAPMTEAQIEYLVTHRVQEAVDAALQGVHFHQRLAAKRDQLIESEASSIPAKGREALRREFSDVSGFDSEAELTEAVMEAAKGRREEYAEVSGGFQITGLGPSADAQLVEARRSGKAASAFNDVIDQRLHIGTPAADDDK